MIWSLHLSRPSPNNSSVGGERKPPLSLVLLSAALALPVACDQGEESRARTDSGDDVGNEETASNRGGQSNEGGQSGGATTDNLQTPNEADSSETIDDAASDGSDATDTDATNTDHASLTDDGGSGRFGVEQSRAGGPCPEAAPEVATACEAWGTHCSYDVLTQPSCREAYICSTALVWAAIGIPGGSCFSPPPPECAEPVVHGDDCESGMADCSSGGATCRCAVTTTAVCSPDGFCEETAPGTEYWWQCTARNAACPDVPRNAGTICEEPMPGCLYGQPCSGLYVYCRDGIIIWEQDICP